MKDKVNVKTIVLIVVICLISIGVLFLSCNKMKSNYDKKINNKEFGSITLNYPLSGKNFKIISPKKLSDAEGIYNKESFYIYDFSVVTELKDSKEIEYEICLEVDAENNIDLNDVKIYLEKEENGSYVKVNDPGVFKGLEKDTKIGSKKGTHLLASLKSDKDGTCNYRLRVWVDKESKINIKDNSKISFNVIVNGLTK